MTKTKKIPGTRLQAWLSGPSEKFQPLQAVRSPYKHGGRDLEKGRGTLVIPWKQPCQVKAAQGRGCRDWKWPSACGWRACRNDSGPSGRLCEGRGSQGARCGHRSLSRPHPPAPRTPPLKKCAWGRLFRLALVSLPQSVLFGATCSSVCVRAPGAAAVAWGGRSVCSLHFWPSGCILRVQLLVLQAGTEG